MRIYIGTYTGPRSEGIYTMSFDPGTGEMSTPVVAAKTENPSFLTIHPNRRWVYAVNELESFGGERSGAMSAFAIEPSGALRAINQRSTHGSFPCHVAVERTGKFAFSANYGGGNIAMFPLGSDGALAEAVMTQHRGSGPDPKRQEGPHVHCVDPDSEGRFLLSCDLGLDKIFSYRIEGEQKKLIANSPPFADAAPASGPRHLAFHPNGIFVYGICEMASTVSLFHYNATAGRLVEEETLSTVAPEYTGLCWGGEVAVHPTGRWLLASERGDSALLSYAIDSATGALTQVARVSSGGKVPRSFAIDPTGKWLLAAHQMSDDLILFKFDVASGQLTQTETRIEVGAPCCVAFLE